MIVTSLQVHFGGRSSSWNLRDRHMAETLDELVAHVYRKGHRARVVVWAHNSVDVDVVAKQAVLEYDEQRVTMEPLNLILERLAFPPPPSTMVDGRVTPGS